MADSNYYGNGGNNTGGEGGGGNHNSSFNKSSSNNNNSSSNTDQGKIFVGGLSWQTTEESCRWHFEQYGPVVSVDLMKDRNTGKPRGFGFVCFAENSTVDLVMAEDKHEINHKIVDVKRAQARGIAPPSIHERNREQATNSSNNAPSNNNAGGGGGGGGGGGSSANPSAPTPEQLNTKVFVGGIPPSIDRDGLRTIFEKFG
jgi:RNA-binding protein Musashi